MRLLDAGTGQFVEKDPNDPNLKYAILSHTWDSNGEQTYPELKEIQRRHAPKSLPIPSHRSGDSQNSPSPFVEDDQGRSSPLSVSLSWPSHNPLSSLPTQDMTPGSQPPTPSASIWADPVLSSKIREACKVAQANGYQYLWIDSCCIDKTSSSELSEAINSMYQWYARADVCYAFLADVPADEDGQSKDSKFRLSRWFTRGWTLQELIAPANVLFLCDDWTFIGSKQSLASLITEVTNISYNALLRIEPLKEFSVAERLSWAARRQTTRVEDRAYSLLGIFGINMPTLYGEGEGAFRRLQEEIMRRIPDQSLFAWTPFHLDSPPQFHELESSAPHQSSRRLFCFGYYPDFNTSSLLAPSLNLFADGGRIEGVSHDEVVRRFHPRSPDHPAPDYTFTPHGIRTQVPVIPLSPFFPTSAIECHPPDIPPSRWYLVVLGCEHRTMRGHLLCRICYIPPSDSTIQFVHCGRMSTLPSLSSAREFDLLSLSPATMKRLEVKTVYIFHLDPGDGALEVARRQPLETINLVLLKKTRDALSALGYAADLRGPHQAHARTHSLMLASSTCAITIEYQHTLNDNGLSLSIQADVRIEGRPVPDPSAAGQYEQASGSRTRRVSWGDSCPWGRSKGMRMHQVMLSTPGARPKPLALNLGLTFAAKDHYAIHVEVVKDLTSPAASSSSASLSQQLTRVGKKGSYWRDVAERHSSALPAADLKSTPRTRTGRSRAKADDGDSRHAT